MPTIKDLGFRTFDDLVTRGAHGVGWVSRTRLAQKWFRSVAQRASTSPSRLMRDRAAGFVNQPQIGEMYAFFYDPKHKKTLPYYDIFPVIFPIKSYTDGFLGLNMHYLPPRGRAALMDALTDLSTNTRLDETTRLNVSYDIISSFSQYKLAKPTIKRYLAGHMRSKFLRVEAVDWNLVAFLPIARFQKASQMQVWAESRRIAAG